VRTISKLALVPAAALAMACAGQDAASVDAELQRDLERASAVGIELASAQNEGRQVVSAIEASGGTVIRPTPGPRRTPKAPPAPVPQAAASEEPTDEPLSTMAEHEAIATETVPQPSPEESAEPGPVIAARPTPAQVSFPGEGSGEAAGTGGGGAEVIGTIIGVVIRGGTTGRVDVCERHPRRRPPTTIDTRLPGRIPGMPTSRGPYPPF
jgi:hypothetical protein